MGGLVLSMALGLTLSNRDLMSADEARTMLNQNLRSGADIIGDDVRVAGQRLRGSPPTLMPIVIENNTITLRRNKDDTVMTLCQSELKGNTTKIYISREGGSTSTHSGCQSSAKKAQVWEDLRTVNGNSPKGTMFIYIHKPDTNGSPSVDDSHGEFFIYEDEGKDSNGFYIIRSPGKWSKEYKANLGTATNPQFQPKMYVLEERRYGLKDGLVTLSEVGALEPSGVIDNVSRMDIVAILNDGTRQTTLTEPSDWARLRAIELTLEGTVTVRGKPVTRTLVSQIFPRNVLSK